MLKADRYKYFRSIYSLLKVAEIKTAMENVKKPSATESFSLKKLLNIMGDKGTNGSSMPSSIIVGSLRKESKLCHR